MKIIYRDYDEKSRNIAGKPHLGIPHDIEVPIGDRTVILRLESGAEIKVSENPTGPGCLILRGLNAQLGLFPSDSMDVLRVTPYVYG